jgi:DNA modification methylase
VTIRILTGDCRDVLKTLPDASAHCIVTSPPYYGLRDYGTAQWEGGDTSCDHKEPPQQSSSSTLAGNGHGTGKKLSPQLQAMARPFKNVCGNCGATRIDKQIGLEHTPDAYVVELVAVFREVWRVLRADGTLWLNLGDSYANDGKWGGASGGKHVSALHGNTSIGRGKVKTGLKPKNLIGIPWRVAFALQADGWTLRQDIIWSKPNPIPESVTDRCTKAHEYIFMFSKRTRYWYDAEAISESAVSDHPSGNSFKRPARLSYSGRGQDKQWNNVGGSRNRRSVWTIAAQPYKGAHFATMPPDLAELCIKAGCPKDGVVLDPFGGVGTTALVADRLGRDAISIDLNAGFAEMMQRRIRDDAGMFAEFVIVPQGPLLKETARHWSTAPSRSLGTSRSIDDASAGRLQPLTQVVGRPEIDVAKPFDDINDRNELDKP